MGPRTRHQARRRVAVLLKNALERDILDLVIGALAMPLRTSRSHTMAWQVGVSPLPRHVADQGNAVESLSATLRSLGPLAKDNDDAYRVDVFHRFDALSLCVSLLGTAACVSRRWAAATARHISRLPAAVLPRALDSGVVTKFLVRELRDCRRLLATVLSQPQSQTLQESTDGDRMADELYDAIAALSPTGRSAHMRSFKVNGVDTITNVSALRARLDETRGERFALRLPPRSRFDLASPFDFTIDASDMYIYYKGPSEQIIEDLLCGDYNDDEDGNADAAPLRRLRRRARHPLVSVIDAALALRPSTAAVQPLDIQVLLEHHCDAASQDRSRCKHPGPAANIMICHLASTSRSCSSATASTTATWAFSWGLR